MLFFIPIPKIWEWVELFPFPFPKSQKSFPLTPGPNQLVRIRSGGECGDHWWKMAQLALFKFYIRKY